MLAWVAAAALLLCGASPARPARQKALAKALKRQKVMVESCAVVTSAGPWTLEVSVDVSVDSAGKVTRLAVGLTPDDAKVRECIEEVLKMAPFPKGAASAQRTWKLSGG